APVVRAAAANCRDKRAIVDVVINGNPQLASEMAQLVGNGCLRGQATHVRDWDIRCGDKANAWNVHLHTIYSGARVVFYIDGYAEVAPDALALMDEALSKQPGSLAITGVPSHGRAAPKMRATMIAEGGIHGNLFAIRGDVL